jgi:hypothetical protein
MKEYAFKLELIWPLKEYKLLIIAPHFDFAFQILK